MYQNNSEKKIIKEAIVNLILILKRENLINLIPSSCMGKRLDALKSYKKNVPFMKKNK